MTVLDEAYRLVDKGWRVFPVATDAKNPAIPKAEGGRGALDATLDKNILTDWFTNNPDWNLGIATGPDNNLTVIDIDGEQGLATIARFQRATKFFNQLETYVVETPNGLHAYYSYHPEMPHGVNLLESFHTQHEHDSEPGKMCNKTHVDCRNLPGGYVVAPPSTVKGKLYTVKIDRPIIALPYAHPAFLNQRPQNGTLQRHTANGTARRYDWVQVAMQGVGKGERNHMATRLIGHYHRYGRLDPGEITILMYGYADNCDPPLPRYEIDNAIRSITSKPTNGDTYGETDDPDRLELLPQIIEDYVGKSNGYFTVEEIDREFQIRSTAEKAVRRSTLQRLHTNNIVQPHATANNRYRKVDDTMEVFDLTNIEEPDPLPIEFPLGLHQQVDMYEGSLFVLAGSPNSGKSAFLLNTALLNRDRFNVKYVNSEMGAQELMKRLTLFKDVPLEEWRKIVFAQKQGNMVDAVRYKDLIAPTLFIVDFLSIQGEEFFRIGSDLEHMANAIGNKGVLIVAIQKKNGEANIYGRGAEFSAERARLYCSLDRLPSSGNNVIQIVKGKNWHGDVQPDGLRKEFKIQRGSTLEDITGWHYSSDR